MDVGTGQLAASLKADPRVVDLEKTDIRLLSPERLTQTPDFAACDVSFVSLRLVMPAIDALLSPTGEAVVLIKPQFEAGRAAVGKGGIVRDPKVHLRVLRETIGTFHLNGFSVAGLEPSPITGGDGNIEFLALLRRGGEDAPLDPEGVIARAHRESKGSAVK